MTSKSKSKSKPQPKPQAQSKPATWLNRSERGLALGISSVFWFATILGRTPTRAFIRILAFYYWLFDRTAARASREWLEAVHGRPPTRRMVYQHLLRFAQVTLDRIFLLQGKTNGLKFTRTGDHYLQDLAENKRGAVLVGAHLGSYDAGRKGGAADHVPINIVGYFENARLISALFARLNPKLATNVIHIGGDPMSFMVRVRERIDAGELVAVLADRVGLGERSVPAKFFGREARFAAGPFLIASILRCPVYLVFGLYHEPNHYALYCEPFAERLDLPRGRRDEALHDVVQRYADRLEHYCRKAPDNWFNFYDFWRVA
ncbi:MAG: hypothetical protein V3V08_18360 [Nannocystaceae bacterium]